MKKSLLVLALLGTFIHISTAKVQIGVGVKVGPALGRWNNGIQNVKLATVGGTVGYQVGVHAGVQARVWFNKYAGLNMAAEFNMSGSSFTRVLSGGNFVQTHKENQLTIPLTAMAGWGNERLRFFGNVGGYFGYNVSGKDEGVFKLGTNLPPTTEKATYGKDGYNAIDAGIRVGGGFQVYVDKTLRSCVTFDINYDYGLIKTFRGPYPFYFPAPDRIMITPSKLTIGVGFIYAFGKSQAEEKPKRDSNIIK